MTETFKQRFGCVNVSNDFLFVRNAFFFLLERFLNKERGTQWKSEREGENVEGKVDEKAGEKERVQAREENKYSAHRLGEERRTPRSKVVHRRRSSNDLFVFCATDVRFSSFLRLRLSLLPFVSSKRDIFMLNLYCYLGDEVVQLHARKILITAKGEEKIGITWRIRRVSFLWNFEVEIVRIVSMCSMRNEIKCNVNGEWYNGFQYGSPVG